MRIIFRLLFLVVSCCGAYPSPASALVYYVTYSGMITEGFVSGVIAGGSNPVSLVGTYAALDFELDTNLGFYSSGPTSSSLVEPGNVNNQCCGPARASLSLGGHPVYAFGNDGGLATDYATSGNTLFSFSYDLHPFFQENGIVTASASNPLIPASIVTPFKITDIDLSVLFAFSANAEPFLVGNITHGDLEVSLRLPATPEPSTWAMMILGFAGIGFATYRRSRRPMARSLSRASP
jgi:hypothetical protein